MLKLAPRLALGAATVLIVLLAIQNRNLENDVRAWRVRATRPHMGLTVPVFRTATIVGDSVEIGSVAPGKRQILLVFSSTCGFCIENLSSWKQLASRIEQERSEIALYGVSTDPERETRRFVEEYELQFPVVRFPNQRLQKLYRADGVPLTLVVEQGGELSYAMLGMLDRPKIDSLLELVAETPPKGLPYAR